MYSLQIRLVVSWFCLLAIMLTGCNTVGSLGLPVGGLSNRLSRTAKKISELPGQSIALPTELSQQPLASYLVEIGDTLFVEPVHFDSAIRLPGDQIVKPDGTISLGEFGNVHVHGKTIEQIQSEVQLSIDQKVIELRRGEQQPTEQADDEVAWDYQDQNKSPNAEPTLEQRINREMDKNRVNVRLVNWDSKRFYVLGEVNSPGFFQFTGSEDVLYAITQAGGLSSKSNRHQIVVARPTSCGSCRVVMKVCYDEIVQLGDTSTNYKILPGDRVFVPCLSFLDDLRESLLPFIEKPCPRCAGRDTACRLPQGCAP